jgi:hypothetical protein
LGAVNGISKETANLILKKYCLIQLVNATEEQLAACEYINKSNMPKKIGPALAKKIYAIFNYISVH